MFIAFSVNGSPEYLGPDALDEDTAPFLGAAEEVICDDAENAKEETTMTTTGHTYTYDGAVNELTSRGFDTKAAETILDRILTDLPEEEGNETHNFWEDELPLSTEGFVAPKDAAHAGVELFAVAGGEAFRVFPPAAPFHLSEVVPFASDLDPKTAVETYGREWIVVWAADADDALARSEKYDRGYVHLDALVEI